MLMATCARPTTCMIPWLAWNSCSVRSPLLSASRCLNMACAMSNDPLEFRSMPIVSSRLCLCCSDVGALPLRAWKIICSSLCLSLGWIIPSLNFLFQEPRWGLVTAKIQDQQGINWADVALIMRRACATKHTLSSIYISLSCMYVVTNWQPHSNFADHGIATGSRHHTTGAYHVI